MNAIVEAIVLSMLPISELRGGIPVAIYGGINPLLAFVICVAANVVVVPIIYLFLEHVNGALMNIDLYKRTFEKFLEHARKRAHKLVERYGYAGLIILAAIPLPGGGAWTSVLAAWFFGMERKKSFLSIFLGVAIAGVIVTTVVVFGISVLRIFIK